MPDQNLIFEQYLLCHDYSYKRLANIEYILVRSPIKHPAGIVIRVSAPSMFVQMSRLSAKFVQEGEV